MPGRLAAESGMLGHHAVVVALRHLDPVFPHHAAQRRGDSGVRRPAAEHGPARVGVQQPARGVASGHVATGRGARITHVRLEFHRGLQRVERAQHRRAHLLHARAVHQSAHDQVAVAPERVREQLAHRVRHEVLPIVAPIVARDVPPARGFESTPIVARGNPVAAPVRGVWPGACGPEVYGPGVCWPRGCSKIRTARTMRTVRANSRHLYLSPPAGTVIV